MSDPLSVLLLVTVLVAGVTCLDVLIRRPIVAAGVVLGARVVSAALSELPEPVIGRPDDFVFLLILIAAIARLLRIPHRTAGHILLIGIWALMVFSLARGILEYGVPAAQEFRSSLEFLGTALYFSTVRLEPGLLARIGRLWIWASIVLVGLVSLRYLAVVTGLNLGILAPTHVSATYALRALDGPTSFTIGVAFLMAVAASNTRELRLPSRMLLMLLFGTFTILLNRRAVYAAVLVGLFVLILRNRTVSSRLAIPLVVVALVSSFVLVGLPQASTIGDGDEVAASVTDTGTLDGRVEGWNDLLSNQRGMVEWMIGAPFGAGYEREISEREVESNPHSLYVQVFLRLGIAGLMCMLAFYGVATRRLLGIPASVNHLLSGPSLLVLLAAQIVFFIAWHTRPEHGIILGLACAPLVTVYLGEHAGSLWAEGRHRLSGYGSTTNPAI